MTKTQALAIRNALEALLKSKLEPVGPGFVVKVGPIKYGTTARITLDISPVDKDTGEVTTKEALDFRARAVGLGLHPDDLGREFKTLEGITYRIMGLRRRAPKYPIIAQAIGTGRVMLFTVVSVRAGFERMPPRGVFTRTTPVPRKVGVNDE